jgi:hypothetical protein
MHLSPQECKWHKEQQCYQRAETDYVSEDAIMFVAISKDHRDIGARVGTMIVR